MLSENDGSGMDFFKKLSTALTRAALCGKHRFLLTGLSPELRPATAASSSIFSFAVSCSSTSILLSSLPVLFTYMVFQLFHFSFVRIKFFLPCCCLILVPASPASRRKMCFQALPVKESGNEQERFVDHTLQV